jgi:glutamate formiminotransferase / 5-formyltetrahydrofolate cyclo-ligase
VIFECVINVSEGRDTAVLSELASAASPLLLDTHRDPDHHRAVFTLAGPPDAWPKPPWPDST